MERKKSRPTCALDSLPYSSRCGKRIGNKRFFYFTRCWFLKNCNKPTQRAFHSSTERGSKVTSHVSDGPSDTGVETGGTWAPNKLFRVVQIAVRSSQCNRPRYFAFASARHPLCPLLSSVNVQKAGNAARMWCAKNMGDWL